MYKIVKLINEEIISQQQSGGLPMPSNPEYNGGERETINLPAAMSNDLLRHPDYMFVEMLRGGNNQSVTLLFNGKEFLINVEANSKTYYAHITEQEYTTLKERYQGLYIRRT